MYDDEVRSNKKTGHRASIYIPSIESIVSITAKPIE